MLHFGFESLLKKTIRANGWIQLTRHPRIESNFGIYLATDDTLSNANSIYLKDELPFIQHQKFKRVIAFNDAHPSTPGSIRLSKHNRRV